MAPAYSFKGKGRVTCLLLSLALVSLCPHAHSALTDSWWQRLSTLGTWPWQQHSSSNPSATTDVVLDKQSKHLAAAGPAVAASGQELDDVQTVWSPEAVQLLPRLAEFADEENLDLERAKRMGKITSVAYCSDAAVIQAWTCTRCQRVDKYKVYEVVFDQQWDLLGYVGYDEAQDAITVAFRGTDSSNWGNWLNNLKAWRANQMLPIPEAPHAMVHAGFYNLWSKSSLQANITRLVGELVALHPTPRLFVTGHSMGAALANLCALDLKFAHQFTEVRSWTFGSPRVGNLAWQQLFAQHVTESWRFTHNRDVVPSLPPQMIGFHHVGREAWTVDMSGQGGLIELKILVCDSSGEDPSCHNSACMLGLCTSVADHLVYLGIEMYRDASEC
mmetsp:Transcript_6418/g.10983  ORF Transcript_6418/g.10983 Transcript_6418/m.10983 type:complete len:388 (+) Transcript_6418:33-1196(+)